eukprot:544416-Rhodomonas_salina.1
MSGAVEVINKEYEKLKREILDELVTIDKALQSLQGGGGSGQDKLLNLEKKYTNILSAVNRKLIELNGLKLNANLEPYLKTALMSGRVCRACGAMGDSEDLIEALRVITEEFKQDPTSLQAQSAAVLGFVTRERGVINSMRNSMRSGEMLGKRKH